MGRIIALLLGINFIYLASAQNIELPKEPPQFYGFYALIEGELFELSQTEELYSTNALGGKPIEGEITELGSGDMTILVYSPNAAEYANQQIAANAVWFLEKRFGTEGLEPFGFYIIADKGAMVEFRAAPVEGKSDMVLLIPREPLPPGLWAIGYEYGESYLVGVPGDDNCYYILYTNWFSYFGTPDFVRCNEYSDAQFSMFGNTSGQSSASATSNSTPPDSSSSAENSGAKVIEQPSQVLDAHSLRVSFLTYNPDGKLLASASEDATIKLWDVDTGKLVRTFAGHQKWVNGIAFSPDGKVLASASDDSSVRIWDVETGRELYSLLGHTDWVGSVSFHPSGRYLVSAGADGMLRVWDLENRTAYKDFMGHTGWARAFFSSDGKRLVSASGDTTVRLWDFESGTELRQYQGHTDGVLFAAFSSDASLIASASMDGTVRVWEDREKFVFTGHTGKVVSLAFQPNGTTLLSAADDGKVLAWDVRTGELIASYGPHSNRVLAVTWRPDGTGFSSGVANGNIYVWRAEQQVASYEQCLPDLAAECLINLTVELANTTREEYTRDSLLVRVADMQGKIGDTDGAIATINVTSSSHLAEIVGNLLVPLVQANDFEGARLVAERLQDDYLREEAMNTIIDSMISAGLFDEAIALAGEVGSPYVLDNVYTFISQTEAQAGHLLSALSYIGRISEAGGRDYARGLIVQTLLEPGEFAEALELVRTFEDIDNQNRTVGDIARAQAEDGKLEEALQTLQLREDSEDYTGYNLAFDLARAGNTDGFQKVLDAFPALSTHEDLPRLRATLAAVQGDSESTLSILLSIAEAYDRHSILATLAKQLYITNKQEAAYNLLEQVGSEDVAAIHEGIFHAQLEQQDLVAAKETAENLLNNTGQNLFGYLFRAQLEQDDLEGASASLEHLAAEEKAYSLEQLISKRIEQGDFEKALQTYEHLSDDPAYYCIDKARLWALTGQVDKAKATALLCNSTRSIIEAFFEIARVQVEGRDVDGARVTLLQVLDESRGLTSATELGVVYLEAVAIPKKLTVWFYSD